MTTRPRPTPSSTASTPTWTPPTPTSRTATSTSSTSSRPTPSRPRRGEFGDRFIRPSRRRSPTSGFPTYDAALRRPAGPSGHLDGHRPRGDLRGDLRRHPHPGRLVHRAGRRRLPRGLPASTARSTSTRPRRCSTRPASTAASRSTCGSTPAPATTRGWRPWATSCARTSASSSPSRATSTSPSTCRSGGKGLTGPFRYGWSFDYPSRGELPDAAVHAAAAAAGGFELQLLRQPGGHRADRPGRPGRAPRTRRSSCTRRPRTSSSRTCRWRRCSSPRSSRCTRRTSSNVTLDLFQRRRRLRGHRSADRRKQHPHDPPGALSTTDGRPRRRACRQHEHMDTGADRRPRGLVP